MELGKSVDQSGKAAFRHTDCRAHDVSEAFGKAIGYDCEGHNVSPETPQAGFMVDHKTAHMDDSKKNS